MEERCVSHSVRQGRAGGVCWPGGKAGGECGRGLAAAALTVAKGVEGGKAGATFGWDSDGGGGAAWRWLKRWLVVMMVGQGRVLAMTGANDRLSSTRPSESLARLPLPIESARPVTPVSAARPASRAARRSLMSCGGRAVGSQTCGCSRLSPSFAYRDLNRAPVWPVDSPPPVARES